MCRYACSPFPAGQPAVFLRHSDERPNISDTVTTKKRKLNYTCCLATSPSVIQWCRMVLNLRTCRGETKRGLRKSRTQSLWSKADQSPWSLILFLDLNSGGCMNLPCHWQFLSKTPLFSRCRSHRVCVTLNTIIRKGSWLQLSQVAWFEVNKQQHN